MMEEETIIVFDFDEQTETSFNNGDIITSFQCVSPPLGVEGGSTRFTLRTTTLQGNGEKSDVTPVVADPTQSLKNYRNQYVRFENMVIDDYQFAANTKWRAAYDNLGNYALVSLSFADKGWPNIAIFSYVDCLLGYYDSRMPYTHMIIIDLGDETRVVHDFDELTEFRNEPYDEISESTEYVEGWGAPRSFMLKGETTVYMHKGNHIWLNDGTSMELMMTTSVADQLFPQGTILSSFTGMTPDISLTGGILFYNLDTESLTSSGKTVDITPIECEEGKTFTDYTNYELVRYHNVTASTSTYQGMTIPMITDEAGNSVFIPLCYDGIPEPGEYSYIDAITYTYATDVHVNQIVGFKVGEPSGVGSILSGDTEVTVSVSNKIC